MITTERLEELKRLAEAATPGPWTFKQTPKYGKVIELQQHMPMALSPKDAKFIAALNPATALELLDEIERLTKEVDIRVMQERLVTTDKQRLAALELSNQRLRGEFALFIKTMTAINKHQGYPFTQVIMTAKANFDKLSSHEPSKVVEVLSQCEEALEEHTRDTILHDPCYDCVSALAALRKILG